MNPRIARRLSRSLACFWLAASVGVALGQQAPTARQGVLRDAAGNPVAGALVTLREVELRGEIVAMTDSGGQFEFAALPAGKYSVSVELRGREAACKTPLVIREGDHFTVRLVLSADHRQLALRHDVEPVVPAEPGTTAQKSGAATGVITASKRGAEPSGVVLPAVNGRTPASSASEVSAPVKGGATPEESAPKGTAEARASGGERLSSREVSGLPLNKRDFSQLILLAAGTMTDTNGAANFTQQFAVNGQRGTTTVFAMDGIDTTDAEMGGATFANFNVDAVQEIRSSSGVMPAEIGHGAAGFTEIITKSGTAQLHGSAFEFLRNAALDARNFFDRRSFASPGRIPPFVRNEFGFTIGGPITFRGEHHTEERSFFFGQYQGFRQVLGTTQVIAVPTPEERQGINTSAFPGDTLLVPVNPKIAPVLARYPLPNDPQGPYGARTYATSSKVSTRTDQFSVRIDHRISDKATLFARFNLNQVTGPLTNPSQTAIDPSFAVRLGFVRSTPFFAAVNLTQPGLMFGDGLYEPFNSAAGGQLGSYGNLLQVRQSFTYVRGSHTLKLGFEARFNRDTTIFGTGPNGEYNFGGGRAYAPVEIPSASGAHDIHVGDPLPDALTGFLTATPQSYTASVAAPGFAQGAHIGESAIHRDAYNVYLQDAWKITPRLVLNYGLRYEVSTRIREAKHRTSAAVIIGPDDRPAHSWDEGARQRFLFYPQPPYGMDWGGWGPRATLEWRAANRTVLRVGGAVTTLLLNLWQDNALTGGIPFVFNPYLTAAPGAPVPFENAVTAFNLPPVLTPDGQPVFVSGHTTDVPANTEIDLQRFQEDLAAITPGNQIQPLLIFVMSSDYRNGYVGTYTVGFEQEVADIKFGAAYVATVGVNITGVRFPNAYGGADPAFAPFTRFDAAGQVVGGFGPQFLMTSPSHSTFHSLQASASKTSLRAGLGFQASYTFSKSLDDSSAVLGGFFSGGGTILQAWPQDPRNPGAEKGPSTFDVGHVFALSAIQALPLERVPGLRALGRRLTSGWQVLNISTLTSGSPFSVYSGVQQTGAGSGGADRPDQVGQPVFSTNRKIREDYFGRGADNAAFFSIPIGIPGGTGPNQGRFGTLGRNTFRGPAFRNFDVALIKDTPFGRRGSGEAVTLQFRAEFFNVFNLVNFGLPANIVRGSGFGLISRTAGTSRQVAVLLEADLLTCPAENIIRYAAYGREGKKR
ncbi:MAG: TonB-dependent receptor [Terriglobia bacterium]